MDRCCRMAMFLPCSYSVLCSRRLMNEKIKRVPMSWKTKRQKTTGQTRFNLDNDTKQEKMIQYNV